MPLLSITVKASELALDEVLIKLERAYKFTELKLLHIYHNIDSANITANSGKDATQQCLLFIRLGNLIENHKQIINYEGKYQTSKFDSQQNINSNDDFQIGQNTLQVGNTNSVSSGTTTDRYHADVDIFHLIPIGASRFNSHDIISRDVFKSLHKGSILNFTGELKFELHYMDFNGDIVPMNTASGGIVVGSKGKVKALSFITLLFEYEE